MVIDVYLAPPSAPCRAVLMTAKHLGIDVNQKMVNPFTKEQFKPEFLEMNPQHCIPTIDDNGFYLWESRAIQAYLVNKYAPGNSLYPDDPQKRAVIDKMLYFDMGKLYKDLLEYVYPYLFHGEPADPEKLEPFRKSMLIFDELLSKTAYAAGEELTLADQSILAGLTFIEILMDFTFDEYPNVSAWLQKLKNELPYYKEINEDPLIQLKDMISARNQLKDEAT